jgi:hypothetical protein
MASRIKNEETVDMPERKTFFARNNFLPGWGYFYVKN